MPELAEVEITRQKLRPLIRGRKILNFWADWPRALRAATGNQHPAASMRGRKILDVARRGKVLFFKLSGRPERVMAIHLRMSGRLEVAKENKRGQREAKVTKDRGGRWTHFVWKLSGGRELRFVDPRKFGLVWYGSPADLARDPYLGRLGGDMQTLPRAEFAATLAGGRGMIKPFLLRQDRLAGIGNIIADESLWQAGIHPETRIANLDARTIDALHRSIQHTIRVMLASGGTSIRTFRHPDGGAGRYQDRRLVYGKAGNPCPRCRTKLLRIIVGSRGTTICSQCQKL